MVASLVIGIIFLVQAWDFVIGLTAESFTDAVLWEQRGSHRMKVRFSLN